ncbi:MAG TPA: DUF4188 domain-containing protein [Acetobacteraceae bacterium]|nr:DUF4188 domain-containing protein [Acetobacteraceae bacterium]
MDAQLLRRSVDLSAYPDLVVIYLGFRLRGPRGVWSALRIGRGGRPMLASRPEGLLAHETIFFGLAHFGFRQYWRDLECLERFTRSEPHRGWWTGFLKDQGGAGFWHETYTARGGMEAIYVNMPASVGFAAFAPPRQPQGPYMSARGRIAAAGS